MERQDSFSSCKGDSESDGDSFTGSYSNLAFGEIQSIGSDRLHSAHSQAGSTSSLCQGKRPNTHQQQNKDILLQRKSGVKRQAPKPPSVLSGGAKTQLTGADKLLSPVTTVHLQFEPIMPQPKTTSTSSPNTPLASTSAEQTSKITKIASEHVSDDPLVPPNCDKIGHRDVVRPHQAPQSLERSISPPPNPQLMPIQRVTRSQIIPITTGNPKVLNNQPVSSQHYGISGRIPTDSSRPMSPNRPMSPSRPMSPNRPMSPPRYVPTAMNDVSMSPHGMVISPDHTQSRPIHAVYPDQLQQYLVMTPEGELVTTAGYSVPQPQLAPQAPRRSHTSHAATQNMGNTRIRLIDEESDSEAYLSDVTEDIRKLNGGMVPPRRRSSGASSTGGRPRSMILNDPNVIPAEHMVNTHENYDFFSSFDESSQSEAGVVSARGEIQPSSTAVMRGRAKRLSHSASDPGVSRPQHQLLQQQHPRAPGVASSPPTLDQLSEEDIAPTDSEDQREEDLILGPGLKRTESMVTVAHLYEDVLVSSRLRIRVTLTNLTVVVVVAALVLPNTAITLYTAFRLVFGTLFPAYYSYKAVKTKNVKEYVKWMMYWIVFAFFTCFETFTDLFLSFWFPFYYEMKILVVLWLLSPATRGSSILYRKFVHPWLTRREDDIDNCIAQAKQQGYSTVIQLGTKGVNYATTVLMQTAIKASLGDQGGGGIVNQLRRSYSSGELSDGGDLNRNVKALPHIPDDTFDDRTHSSGPYESEIRVRAESDAAYRSRGSSVTRGVRSNKTRSADVTDYYQDSDESIQRRRSPRTQENARSQPMLHFQEPPTKGQQRKRGKSENRQRPKSMINATEVTRGAEWAKAQRVGSTMSLNNEMELTESSSHSSLASIASGVNGQHSVRPKTRAGSTRRPRVNSQGRKITGSTSRTRTQPIMKTSSLEAASESE